MASESFTSRRRGLRLVYFLVAGLALSEALFPTQRVLAQEGRPFAFTHVNVLPMHEDTVWADYTVIVRGDRIMALGPADDTPVPSTAHVIDGEGQFLLPGLVDSHVHLLREPPRSLVLFVANGVTTVRNMNGSPDHLALRQQVAQGRVFGPTVYTTGPYAEDEIETPEDAERVVREQKAAGYDFIKVHGDLPEDAYLRLIETAKQEGLLVVGHVPRNLDAAVALDAGQAEISHAEEYVYTHFDDEVSDTLGVAAIAQATQDAGTWVAPTLVVFDYIVRQAMSDYFVLIRKPELVYITPERRHAWRTDSYREYIEPEETPWFVNARTLLGELVQGLHAAGARLLVGTDTPLEFVIPGFSVHEELQLLMDNGLTPYEALRAATFNAAAFMDALDEFGTIAVGRRADLVLVKHNPLRDVAHLRDRTGVMLRGQWFTSADLERRLEQLAVHYARQEVEVQAQLTTQQRFVDLVLEAGLDAAFERFQTIKREHPDLTLFTEAGLNRIGYQLLAEDRVADAIQIFQLNVKAYPESANVYDSLGEAYMVQGDRERAIRNYQRALEMDPTMDSAVEALSKLKGVDEP